jgi:outer membrane immunogenic protein
MFRSIRCRGVLCLLSGVLFSLSFVQDLKAQNFKGFYIGGYVGGAFGHSDVTTTAAIDNSAPGFSYLFPADIPVIAAAGDKSLSPAGLSAGGQVGYNAQVSNIVFGIEFDYGAMQLRDDVSETVHYPDPGYQQFTFTIHQRIRTEWLFTARPRLGYAAGRVLLFGTGGFAWTEIDSVGVFIDDYDFARASAPINQNKGGWVTGGGAEFRVSRFSIKGEYLHVGFGDLSIVSSNMVTGRGSDPTPIPRNPFTHTTNLSTNIVRAGLNFYF